MMTADAFERRRFVQQHFVGRISSEVFDPGYRNHTSLLGAGWDIRVYLNDVLQEDWITADPEQGFIQKRTFLRTGMKTEIRWGGVAIRILKRLKSSHGGLA